MASLFGQDGLSFIYLMNVEFVSTHNHAKKGLNTIFSSY